MDFDLRPGAQVFSKSKIHLCEQLKVGSLAITVDQVVETLEPLLLEDRIEKLKSVVAKRSLMVTTVLENIYDRGNVSAVMRTAEGLGFFKFILIETPGSKFKAANRVTRGAEKWLDVQVSSSSLDVVSSLKSSGHLVVGTDLNATHELCEVPMDKPIALVIGNEKDGLSEEMKEAVDVRIKIPMVGFSQSYNLSVASALSLFEFYKNLNSSHGMSDENRRQLYANYLLRCFEHPERYFNC